MSEDESFKTLVQKALDYIKSEQWHAALSVLDDAINLYPGMVDLYYEHAYVCFTLTDYQKAIDDYNEILNIDATQSRAYFCRGYLLGFSFSDYEKAISDLQKVSTIDPFRTSANYYLGILYFNKNDYQNALHAYNEALRLKPDYGEVHFLRALVFEQTAAFMNAFDDYTAAAKNGFICTEVYYNLALLYAQFGNFEQARQEFNRAHATASYKKSIVHDGPCYYFHDGRRAVNEDIFPDPEKTKNLSVYLEEGFVRYADYYFRHKCKGCKACVPLRVLVNEFIFSKSLKRTIKMNSDLRIVIPDSPVIDTVRINLFEKYFKNKHNTHNKEKLERDVAYRHLGFKNSYEIDFYLGDELVAVHIVDEGSDALYASYTYYDTSHLKRRLGIFCIIKGIEFAKKLGKTYYYMGWYIEDLPVMSYKKQFRPNQLLIENQWQDFC